MLTSEADDIIDRLDFGDFSRQAFWWKGAALGGFFLSTLVVWLLVFRYQPKKKVSEESLAKLKSNVPTASEAGVLTPKEARKELFKVLSNLELSGEEFENPGVDSPKRKKLETDLYNAWRRFILSHVSVVSCADTTQEMVTKIINLKSSFVTDLYLSFVHRLSIFEKKLYEGMPFWNSHTRLADEAAYFKSEIKGLNWPRIWRNQVLHKWRSR